MKVLVEDVIQDISDLSTQQIDEAIEGARCDIDALYDWLETLEALKALVVRLSGTTQEKSEVTPSPQLENNNDLIDHRTDHRAGEKRRLSEKIIAGLRKHDSPVGAGQLAEELGLKYNQVYPHLSKYRDTLYVYQLLEDSSVVWSLKEPEVVTQVAEKSKNAHASSVTSVYQEELSIRHSKLEVLRKRAENGEELFCDEQEPVDLS